VIDRGGNLGTVLQIDPPKPHSRAGGGGAERETCLLARVHTDPVETDLTGNGTLERPTHGLVSGCTGQNRVGSNGKR
jgi:hypothetical protein